MSSLPQTTRTDTADRMLDLAEMLVQTRGFNGFSYADIASELGVTKATLHYHFPTKAELGLRLIRRYTEVFTAALSQIDDRTIEPLERLRSYVEIYSIVLHQQRMCLCGMLAADYATLPVPMKTALTQFFEANERWLVDVLDQGRATGHFQFSGNALDVARLLVSSLEGAMLVARTFGQPERFQSIAGRLLDGLSATEFTETEQVKLLPEQPVAE